MLRLVEELLILGGIQIDNLQGVLTRIRAAADVKDHAVRAFAQRGQHLILADGGDGGQGGDSREISSSD